ncbi:substrate-binding domain-containing protein [Erysipelotrichaceae bacterium 51-3]
MKSRKTTLQKLGAAALVMMLSGCSQSQPASSSASTISVLSREEGSGTRSAFSELFQLEKEGQNLIVPDAEITNSTAVMMATVSQNPNAIGYISLGSLNDNVKALAIDGVKPSVETITDGTYSISRPFLIAQKEGVQNALADDFKAFILSSQGQKIIADAGYVPAGDLGEWANAGISGSLSVGGSSSVTPVMEKLAEEYQKQNDQAEISVLQTDSSTGASSTAQGVYDLGMLSRQLNDEEKSQSLTSTPIAQDGIALIVSQDNPVDGLSKSQVQEIYSGAITDWSALN